MWLYCCAIFTRSASRSSPVNIDSKPASEATFCAYSPQRLRLPGPERRPLQRIGPVEAAVALDRLRLRAGRRGDHEMDHLPRAEPGGQFAAVLEAEPAEVEGAVRLREVLVHRAARGRGAGRGDDALGDVGQELQIRVAIAL
nr:hypothetical protein GCM10020063_003200 [Dactylosporangium thailandense]